MRLHKTKNAIKKKKEEKRNIRIKFSKLNKNKKFFGGQIHKKIRKLNLEN